MTLRKRNGGNAPAIKAGKLVLDPEAMASWAVQGRLDVSGRKDLVEIPPGLTVRSLNLSNCTSLARLPEGLEVHHLDLSGCTALQSVPKGLRCYHLGLKGTPIRSLPADLQVEYKLDLEGCTELTALPAGLTVGSLVLRGCTALASLPDGLDVCFLDLQGCTRLARWPEGAMVRIGRLNARGCTRLAALPHGMKKLAQLDVSDCTSLGALPEGLQVGSWVDLANTAITSLPDSLAGVRLLWGGVPIDERIAFDPGSITAEEVLQEQNAERRRVLLARLGLDRFLLGAQAQVLDRDRDAGGERRLFRVPLPGDEDLVCVMVHCPSTGGRYLLRVPPTMRTCRQAIAWTAGFDNPNHYKPLAET